MNCLEYYEAYAAAEVSGFIIVPVNYRLTAPEIAAVLRDAGARVLLFEQQYTETVSRLRAELPQIEHWVCIRPGSSSAGGDLNDHRGRAEPPLVFEDLIASGEERGPPISPRPEDYAYLWYTSGTTGKPKGVPWRQEKLLQSARINSHVSEMNGATRVLQVTPAFHIGGKGYVLGASWAGACSVFQRSFDAPAMLEIIQREHITHTFMVAAMVQSLLAVPNIRSFDLSSLQQVFSAAAPIPVPVLRQAIELFGSVFSIQYGCTEVGSITGLPRHLVNPNGSADICAGWGRSVTLCLTVDMRLIDEDGQPCAPGKPGEVVVRSPCMLDGYWNNTPASLEALRGGWYHTGDIGVQDDQGYLFLVDRKKDMIISGGENIYSREVEEAIQSHEHVLDCAVIGVPDSKWVEAVKAVVTLKAGRQLGELDLIAHCKARIASYKCPRSIDFVNELPRLATGKLDKPALRKRYRQQD